MHKKFLKSAVAVTLTLCMLLSMVSVAFAVEGDTDMSNVSTYALENVSTELTQELSWIDIRNTDSPIEVLGLYNYTDRTLQDGNFVRIDPAVAAEVTADAKENFTTNGGNVWGHNQDTTGGRVRFSTNSRYVAVQLLLPVIPTWGSGSMAGKENAAVDVYVDTPDGTTLVKTIKPDVAFAKGSTDNILEGVVDFGTEEARNITLYMPILNPVKEFYVGLSSDSQIGQNQKRYKEGSNVVWYGSSLTEGGSVSHPGYTYAALVSQARNENFTNLGMWGSCHGETPMANYLASIDDMSMFILDYDHNENKASILQPRHWTVYATVRAAHPDIPIIFISRPNHKTEEWEALRAAIQSNYQTAVSNGDKNVYFLDGQTIFAAAENYADCFASATDLHHSDYGSELFARAVLNMIQDIEDGWNEGLTLYQNDFSDATTAEDFSFADAEGFTVADGKLNINVVGDKGRYTLNQSAEWDNYSVSATVNMSSETNKNMIGIHARGGSVRLLLRDMGGEKLRVRAYTTGNTNYETEDIYDYGTDYTLKIMVKGAEIKYFINDTELFTDEDCTATAANGAVGVETFCGNDRLAVASVDNFTVRALGTAGEPKGIIVPDVILAEVGEETPVFDFKLNYGAYGTTKMASTAEGVTVLADTSVENITTYTVKYQDYTASGTMYVLSDKSAAYYDSFDTLNTAAWTVSNATVANGVMTIINGGAKLNKLPGATEWTDYIVEVDITTHGLAASTTAKYTSAAVGVRNASGNNGYEYGPLMNNSNLTGHSYRLYERGTATVSTSYTTYKPTPDVTDHLRIVVSGKTMQFYLLKNGQYILTHEVTDAVHDKGSIRLIAGTECFSVDFDNLLIIPLTEKKLQSITLPNEVVNLPYGGGGDLEMTLNYGMHGTEKVSVFGTEGVELTYDPNKVGEQTLTVQYGGKQASVQVKVFAQTGLELQNFTVEKGATLSEITYWAIYGPVKVKSTAAVSALSGLDLSTVGRHPVTLTVNGFTTNAVVTVVENIRINFDFNDVENGSAPASGWNVTTFGTVTDGVLTTNPSAHNYMCSTKISSNALGVAAEFRLSNSQLNYYFDNLAVGNNTGYGLLRFGKTNGVGQRLAFNLRFDDACTPYLTLTACYDSDLVTLADVEFKDFKLEEFIHLEMVVYGDVVAGFVNGVERVRYTFDTTDTTIPEGCATYNPADFYQNVLTQSTRHGVALNGTMVEAGLDMPVDVDNFVIRDIAALEGVECAHKYEWVIDLEPTCGAAGVKHEVCSECGETRSAETEIPATGEHTYDNVCDGDCGVCGEEREAPHQYEWFEMEPTCSGNGFKQLQCGLCGAIDYDNREILDATGEHTYDNDQDADCNQCGFHRDVPQYVVGDLDGDNEVSDADAVYLLMHTFFADSYPVNQDCDFNKDNSVSDADAVHLLMYTFFPDMYPIG